VITVAVALGLGLQAREVAPCTRLAEELAPDEVAAVHLLQIQVFGGLAPVGQEGRCDHAEADGEGALVGHLVLGLEMVPEAFVRVGELSAAVLAGPGDPSEAGIELRRPPRLGATDVGKFGVAVFLFEHGDLVGALSPDEALFGLLLGCMRVEEVAGLFFEDLERDVVHERAPCAGR
jgi:hypothetical protein